MAIRACNQQEPFYLQEILAVGIILLMEEMSENCKSQCQDIITNCLYFEGSFSTSNSGSWRYAIDEENVSLKFKLQSKIVNPL